MHASHIKGSSLNSLGKTEDFGHGYDLPGFRKTYQAASKVGHGEGRSEACTIGQVREHESPK